MFVPVLLSFQLTFFVSVEQKQLCLQGVRVVSIKPNGPAMLAGFKPDGVSSHCSSHRISFVDVIEQANGEYTRLNSEFRNMIRKVRAGDIISFQVLVIASAHHNQRFVPGPA
jgi:hypothetical protein